LRYFHLALLSLKVLGSFANLSILTLCKRPVDRHGRCSKKALMARFFKPKRILIPDIPSPTTDETRDGLAIISIGVLCGVAAIGALIFVFFAA